MPRVQVSYRREGLQRGHIGCMGLRKGWYRCDIAWATELELGFRIPGLGVRSYRV